ncbi:MAG: GNAT family N-acetyltransferase [Armatimonadetes bacterium]|nr:GNAT family N-acetyltransferase [Armatimonadota bacterium]
MKIEIRDARVKDARFVRDLAVESVTYGIPHTREVSPDYVRARTRKSLAELEMVVRLDPTFKVLVAEDVDKGQLVGYIMLDLKNEESSTGEPQVMIHDLAVRRDYWGRRVVDKLIKAAAEVTASLGLRYLVGEVTRANERTLGTACKGLGFEIERHQIVKICTPKVEPGGSPTAEPGAPR